MRPMNDVIIPSIRRLAAGDKNFWLKYWREKNYNGKTREEALQ